MDRTELSGATRLRAKWFGQTDSIQKESHVRTGHQGVKAATAGTLCWLPVSTFSFSAHETWARNLAVVEVWVFARTFLITFFCFRVGATLEKSCLKSYKYRPSQGGKAHSFQKSWI